MSKRCKDGSRDMRYTSNREVAEREQEASDDRAEGKTTEGEISEK